MEHPLHIGFKSRRARSRLCPILQSVLVCVGVWCDAFGATPLHNRTTKYSIEHLKTVCAYAICVYAVVQCRRAVVAFGRSSLLSSPKRGEIEWKSRTGLPNESHLGLASKNAHASIELSLTDCKWKRRRASPPSRQPTCTRAASIWEPHRLCLNPIWKASRKKKVVNPKRSYTPCTYRTHQVLICWNAKPSWNQSQSQYYTLFSCNTESEQCHISALLCNNTHLPFRITFI